MKTVVLALLLSTLAFGQMDIENTINVEGIGKVSVLPDMSLFSVTATVKSKSYDSTLIKLDKLVKIIFPILDKYNLKKEDFIVLPVSIGEDIEYNNNKWTPNGYKASKEIQIKFYDLSKLSLFAHDVIINSGITISEMQFSHTKIDSLKGVALKLAMDDAKMKAEIVCEHSKLKLGKPILFSTAKSRYDFENEDYYGIGYGSGFRGGIGALMSANNGAIARGAKTLSSINESSQLFNINPGEFTIKDKVLVIYQIVQ